MEQEESPVLSKAMSLEREFEALLDVYSDARSREQRNWNIFAGIDLGQYTTEDKAQASLEGRKLSTFNVTTQKVESLAGALRRNQFDATFIPVDGEDTDSSEIINGLLLSDKEMMDWDISDDENTLGGLIYMSVQEMYMDTRYNKIGNIAFRVHRPGHVMFDPYWKSNSARECQYAYTVTYMTASQFLETFPECRGKLESVEADRKQVEKSGDDMANATDQTVTPNYDLPDMGGNGNLYRVIRKYEMKTEEVTIEYDQMTGRDLPLGSDYAKKINFLNKTNPRWEPDKITTRKEKKRVCMVSTFCTQIDNCSLIEYAPCKIQIGRLPLFPWSAARINGQWRGIVDLVADIQYKINYREELITNMIETEACGSQIVDPALFGEDEDKMKDYEQNKNNPRRVFYSAPGALRQGLLPVPVAKAQFPQDIRDQLMRMWDYADRLSKAPSVFDARSEKSGESGYLFAQKARAAEQQAYLLFSSLKQHLNEKMEAWFEQMKYIYSAGNLERSFRYGNGKNVLTVNKRVYDEEGKEKFINKIADIPRHKVIITESPSSSTNRSVSRMVANETLRVIPPELLGTRTVMSSIISTSLDNISSADKQDLEEMAKLEKEMAKETLRANILKLQAANIEATKQLEAAKNPQPAPPPTAIPAPPPEAAQPPVAAPVAGTDGAPVAPEKSLGYTNGGQV